MTASSTFNASKPFPTLRWAYYDSFAAEAVDLCVGGWDGRSGCAVEWWFPSVKTAGPSGVDGVA